ncbi:hypothetical protein QOZ80_4AG0311060 [Eleusine coracana subsp. coracana]|nr:hypothetical protein QOZ80_4AG0311060 [Eleusine coracana subsp. coracana]
MLLRSSSTPFLHSFRSSSPSSLHLRRAFSDGHIPSLHPSAPNDNSSGKNTTGGLHTELSFSIYNTSSKGAPLAAPQPSHDQFGFEQEQDQQTVQQPEQPELPLFLARGLGIDRIASGLFTAGAASKPKMEAQDDKVAALDAQYKKMVDEQPGNALFLRNYAQFLHEVKGDPKRAEEYYSRAMLADPSDGEIMSQYAKLVWEVHHDRERSLSYFQKSVQAAPQNSHVLAAYASFLWEQDDDDFGEGEESTGGAAPEQGTGTGQVRELASAAV